MAALIIILVLAFIGVLISAFMAGGSEKRKNALLWSAGGVLLSALTGGALFFCKEAVKEILLKQKPHLSFMAESINIPWQIMLQLGMTVFSCGIILSLWSYNCRKSSSKWYWALLWTLGVAFLIGHLLFLPQYYGIAAFVNFFVSPKQDVFSLDLSMLPAFYVMLAVNLLGALLWLWHTLKTEKHSWKNILVFAGSFTGFVCLVWLSAWCAGTWAKKSVDTKAAVLGITPSRVAANEPAELKSLVNPEFYTKHPKYNPPRSGKYDWKKDTIPADEKAYTMKFFTSPELETYLTSLKRSAAYIAQTDVQYLSPLQHFRSLVRHRADIAELYYRTNQKEKVLPELLKYPELESLIPADTPFLICELVRTATRNIWINALIQYGPEDKSHLPTYRKFLDWSKSWKVHLPCEAGFYLVYPPEIKGKIAAFFYAPHLNTARYRGFFDAVKRIPALKKLEQAEIISGDGMYAKAAKRQRLGMIMGQIALALKVYKIEHGKYPGKLSELVPNYLPKEYVSPSTGKKLDYSVKGTNFTLVVDGSSITSER
ncbi:MAG: hypothetical protein E7042_05600 [Lentisphaerae bacterium]|nr:hypothetical protein [Lentisphaerota bacterium]